MTIKIDLVIPRGRHSWNLGEGWVEALRRKGMLGRVFHLDRDSEASVLEHAPKEESDLIILMGGDHHLESLHNSPQKRDAWLRSRVPRVAFCYESILDSRFPGSLEKSASATEAFTHFAFCDEKDAAFFATRNVPAVWLPQCVDHRRFCPGVDPRKPQVFFRGKGDPKLRYDLRPRLIEKLRLCPEFAYFPDEMSDEELMRAYAEYACVINLPGNFFGYNVRTFEALAAGAVLFQHRVKDRPKNEALFTDRQLIPYSADDPEALIVKMAEVTRNLGDYRQLAAEGREACLAAHTIDHRIQEIITFVEHSYRSAPRLHLACGSNILPNHVNIDAASQDHRVLIQNMGRLGDLPDGEAESIYACCALGRLSREEARPVVETWAKKLRPGGTLYLAEPDMRFLSVAGLLRRLLRPFSGGRSPSAGAHCAAFDRKSLKAVLHKAGFSRVRTFEFSKLPFTRWDSSRDALSLNLVAQLDPVDADEAGPINRGAVWCLMQARRYTQGLWRFLKEKR